MRRLELMPLAVLAGARVNPKRHDAEGIAASISRFGFIEPIVLDERTGRIVSGHGRRDDLLARRAAGESAPEGVEADDDDWLVPVVRGWSSADDDEADAYLVAANRLTELGGWDEGELAPMLARLADEGPGLDGTGYSQDDLDDLFAGLQEGEPEGGARDGVANRSDAGVRALVLDYPLDEYERVTAAAAKAREETDKASNAELFAFLLGVWEVGL